MALFSAGQGKKIIGKSVLAYRLGNTKAIDSKDVHEVRFDIFAVSFDAKSTYFQEIFFSLIPEDVTVIKSIYEHLMNSMKPALTESKDYGNCSEAAKARFLFGVETFQNLLKSKCGWIQVQVTVHAGPFWI